ncbi:MAG: GC-type dockerin domain-anchored protein [Armatimonadota bacterium]|nr:GC-type dockerin domain-anchored protein [Armatimonadota bacterium]
MEPNGTVRRFVVHNPLLRQFWFFSDFQLLPVGRAQWLVGASTYRNDRDYDIFEPLRSFVGFFALEGDANGDGCVSNTDLITVLLNFGSSDPDADMNGDGVVNNADLLLVLFNFGAGC